MLQAFCSLDGVEKAGVVVKVAARPVHYIIGEAEVQETS